MQSTSKTIRHGSKKKSARWDRFKYNAGFARTPPRVFLHLGYSWLLLVTLGYSFLFPIYHLRPRPRFLSGIFFKIRFSASQMGPHCDSFGETLDQNTCFLFLLVSRSLFVTVLGSESGRLGLQKQGFGVKGVAKTIFSQMLEFC